MNFVPVITHAFAILAGWLLVSFACLRVHHPAVDQDPRPTPARSTFRAAAPRPTPSPRSLLAAQAAMPMDPGRRDALKERIFRDWAQSDPAGMLRHLDDRPWLTGLLSPTEDALNTLARTDPADLLDYARRHGCSQALFALSANGDPRLALDLFLDHPAGTIPTNYYRILFQSGCELEPRFHDRLDLITDPEARLAAALGATAVLLDQRREATVFPWLARHADTLPPEPIAKIVAQRLVRNQASLDALSRLPDSIRSEALGPALQQLANPAAPHPDAYRRDCLTTLLQNGWLANQGELAASVIASSNQHDAPWKEWALDLPDHPEWDLLRQTTIHHWALQDPTQWESFADLPSQDLRDTAYAAALHTIHLPPNADHVPWLIDQIANPAVRTLAVETATRRLQDEQPDPLTITTGTTIRK